MDFTYTFCIFRLFFKDTNFTLSEQVFFETNFLAST